jgi:hypothetical protein
MAIDKVSSLSSQTQFPGANDLDIREIAHESFAVSNRRSLHMAIIQQPVRKWERPWRPQRAIVLFANSPEETKLRLQLEGRMRHGEQVLQIISVGE